MKTYTLEQYLKLVGVNAKDINDWEDLSDALNYYTDGALWAYPMCELDYCIENHINVCIVEINEKEKALAEIH